LISSFCCHSVGSDEEEEEEEGAHRVSVNQGGEDRERVALTGELEVTSPTLVAVVDTKADDSGSPPHGPAAGDGGTATPDDDESNVSIGKVSTISKEDGTAEVDQAALSPPIPLPSSQEAAAPQITLTEVQSTQKNLSS
jgi:hypothetical protein